MKRLSRVLVLLPGADIGGAEAHTAWLARSFAASGLGVRLAIAAPLRDRFAALLGPRLAAGLDAAPIAWDTARTAEANERRQAETAAALIADAQPDAAVVPLPWPTHGLGLQRALAEAGVPTLTVAHLAPVEPEPESLAARALRPGPTEWVAVSGPVAARLAAHFDLPPGAVSVVPNGVEVPPEDPRKRAAARAAKRARVGLAGRAPLFVFAGRLEPNKGADLLPALAERLHAATGGGGVAVLGGGGKPLRGWDGAGAPPRRGLHPLGHVPDVPDWLLAADALLLPSRLEGCPLVFLEAAARRCPVVATAAAVECFGDDAHAVAAVSQEGSAAAVADRALAALAEPVATRRRVEAAHRRAAAHDAAAMLRQYAALLRAVVAL